MPGNRRGFARQFTLQEVELATDLRDNRRWEWDAIATKIGDEALPGSIKKAVELHRRGAWKHSRPRTRPLRAQLEVAVSELGVTDMAVLCEFFGITIHILSYNLGQMGLDLEMRKQIRREHDLRTLQSMNETERRAT